MDKLRANGNPPECTEDPIDSASAHWNSEASVIVRKSRRCNEKALLLYRLPLRVQGPKVRRLNLRNTVVTVGSIGGREREISTYFAIGNFLMHGYSSWETVFEKSKGYRGLLFHCALRSVPRKVMQSAGVLSVMCRLLARPLVNTRAYPKERCIIYSRHARRSIDILDPCIWDSRTIYWVCIIGPSARESDRRFLILVRETGLHGMW